MPGGWHRARNTLKNVTFGNIIDFGIFRNTTFGTGVEFKFKLSKGPPPEVSWSKSDKNSPGKMIKIERYRTVFIDYQY